MEEEERARTERCGGFFVAAAATTPRVPAQFGRREHRKAGANESMHLREPLAHRDLYCACE